MLQLFDLNLNILVKARIYFGGPVWMHAENITENVLRLLYNRSTVCCLIH